MAEALTRPLSWLLSGVLASPHWTVFLFLGYTCTYLCHMVALFGKEYIRYIDTIGARVPLVRCASKVRHRRLS
jgi:hypothetical protein